MKISKLWHVQEIFDDRSGDTRIKTPPLKKPDLHENKISCGLVKKRKMMVERI
jgi:hypothetical protein